MIKAEEEKGNTHDPEYFLTISFSQLASQFLICFFRSRVARFTGVRMSGVVITDLPMLLLGAGVRE